MRSAQGSGQQKKPQTATASKRLGVLLSGLIDAGAIVPPLKLERMYLTRLLKAQIEPDGTVSCMGRDFHTLSSAASYARSTCSDRLQEESHKLSSNGWAFWQFRNDSGELENIGSIRRRFLRG